MFCFKKITDIKITSKALISDAPKKIRLKSENFVLSIILCVTALTPYGTIHKRRPHKFGHFLTPSPLVRTFPHTTLPKVRQCLFFLAQKCGRPSWMVPKSSKVASHIFVLISRISKDFFYDFQGFENILSLQFED